MTIGAASILSSRRRAFQQYLSAVERLDRFARERYGKRVLHLAVRWVLDSQPLSIALWSARHPTQLNPIPDIMGWTLDAGRSRTSTRFSPAAFMIRSGRNLWHHRRTWRLNRGDHIMPHAA